MKNENTDQSGYSCTVEITARDRAGAVVGHKEEECLSYVTAINVAQMFKASFPSYSGYKFTTSFTEHFGR